MGFNKHPIKSQDLGKVKTIYHLEWIYNQIDSIIDLMDEGAIADMTSGYEKDISKILGVIEEEAIAIFNDIPEPITSNKFYELTDLTRNLDESLKILNYNYFKLTMLPNFYLGHHSIEWGNLIQIYQNVAFLASRSLGKSFEFSFAYPLWQMYGYNRGTELNPISRQIELKKFGVIVTNKHALGKVLLKIITDEIRENELLWKKLKPDGAGLGKEEIECKNGASLALRSYDSSIRGLHPGWIGVDDFLDKSCIYSKEQRDKFIDVFQAEIMKAVEPDGQVIVVGTPFHHEDLYSVLRNDHKWKLFEYPAIFPNGELAAPHRYTYELIESNRKSLGSLIFSREILCVPVSDTSTIFPYSILENAYKGMESFTLVSNIHSHPKKFIKVRVGCDFALSANIGADSSVFSVWGLDQYNDWWLLHIWRGQGKSHNEQLSKLSEIERNFDPNEIIMETNGFQRIMADLARERGIRGVTDFNTDSFNKKDMYDGLPSLAVLFEQGRIHLPRGDEYSTEQTDWLCGEFNSITIKDNGKLESAAGHDDGVMSSFLAIKGSKNEQKNDLVFITA
jgi:hypothetical protein